MRVLIQGVGPTNKGAELLLRECVNRLRQEGHVPLVNVRDFGWAQRRELGVQGYLAIERLRSLRGLGLAFLPLWFNKALGLFSDAHLGAVIDASGYSLTDAWGPSPAESRLERLRRWNKLGVKYVMLPQALGPLEKPRVRAAVASVIAQTDRVYVRDPESLQYANSVSLADSNNIQLAPDITIAFKVESLKELDGKIVIVPNWNIAERGVGESQNRYIESLAQIVRELTVLGESVIGMSHEGPRDTAILREVGTLVAEFEILEPKSGLEAKELLGGAKLVIGGRYHSIVSALAQKVPVIAHSWSHKYSALLDDFNLKDRLADPYEAISTIRIFETMDLGKDREVIGRSMPKLVDALDQLWTEVFLTLEVGNIAGASK